MFICLFSECEEFYPTLKFNPAIHPSFAVGGEVALSQEFPHMVNRFLSTTHVEKVSKFEESLNNSFLGASWIWH